MPHSPVTHHLTRLRAIDAQLDRVGLREAMYVPGSTQHHQVLWVRKQRKHAHPEVAQLAMQLLRSWRLRIKMPPAWKAWRSKGYAKTKADRHPQGTKTQEVAYTHNGRNFYRYMIPTAACYGGRIWDYLPARLQVYIPLYRVLVQQTGAFQGLQAELTSGKTLLLLDYDAPESPTEMTLAQLPGWSRQPSPHGRPFGHAYVLAWALLDAAAGQGGRVFVARLPGRGSGQSWPSVPGALRINVTSGSGNKIAGHKATQLSPMQLGPVCAETCGAAFPGGPSAELLENYWQYGKIFAELHPETETPSLQLQ